MQRQDSKCQDSRRTHIPHPQIPKACSHPAPGGPGAPPQTPVLPTVRPHTATHHLTRDPHPRSHNINQARHRHGTHEHHRHRTHTCQHARGMRRHTPTPPSLHRYRQPPATACSLRVRQRLPQTALPCNPDHWVCLGAAHRLTHCPHCGDLNPHQRTLPAASAPPPPASHRSFFGLLTDALRDFLGGHYVADPADHAWTIAVAKGGAPLPPLGPPLRHSGGGSNVAVHHILLAIYLHQRDLHLRNPQLSAPRAAAPGAWAGLAPEEVADYLRRTCRPFNTALSRQKGTPYPRSAFSFPTPPPTPHS